MPRPPLHFMSRQYLQLPQLGFLQPVQTLQRARRRVFFAGSGRTASSTLPFEDKEDDAGLVDCNAGTFSAGGDIQSSPTSTSSSDDEDEGGT